MVYVNTNVLSSILRTLKQKVSKKDYNDCGYVLANLIMLDKNGKQLEDWYKSILEKMDKKRFEEILNILNQAGYIRYNQETKEIEIREDDILRIGVREQG